jgi:hypothetical protein
MSSLLRDGQGGRTCATAHRGNDPKDRLVPPILSPDGYPSFDPSPLAGVSCLCGPSARKDLHMDGQSHSLRPTSGGKEGTSTAEPLPFLLQQLQAAWGRSRLLQETPGGMPLTFLLHHLAKPAPRR